jgi:hypothetical protein
MIMTESPGGLEAGFLVRDRSCLRLTPSERPKTIEEFSQRLMETEEGSSNAIQI